VSPGCRICYARGMSHRLAAMGQKKYQGITILQGSHVVWTGKVNIDEKTLLEPLTVSEPRTYFVNAMSDLFHENLGDVARDRICAVMALCPHHTFIVLTKRAKDMHRYLASHPIGIHLAAIDITKDWLSAHPRAYLNFFDDRPIAGTLGPDGWKVRTTFHFPLPNVVWGVSTENKETAAERILYLLQTPAAYRMISAEPLLGPLDLERLEYNDGEIDRSDPDFPTQSGFCINALTGEAFDDENGSLSTAPDGEVPLLGKLDWVIVGGESSKTKDVPTPMDPTWARVIRDDCKAAKVPFFFKQWGDWWPHEQGNYPGSESLMELCSDEPTEQFARIGKLRAGHLLDGKVHQEMPVRQEVAA